MYIPPFFKSIHPLDLGCFPNWELLLATVNSAAMSVHVPISVYLFLILLGIYLGVKLLGHLISLWLTF